MIRYCLLSITQTVLPKVRDHVRLTNTPGTPYSWADSDPSTQYVGPARVDGKDRVYWISPDRQAGQVICELHEQTGERVHVQWTIPNEFREEMRDRVKALRSSREYKSEGARFA